MTKNLNTSPYFDDFDAGNDFHQILFKPSYPVQARELTQLQSISRDQIAKFGGHVFKHGSVVIPGNSNSDLNICYVKLQSTNVDVTTLENKTIVGGSTGLRAIIRKGIAATNTDPATLFVSYYNSGSGGEKLFEDGESLDIDGTLLSAAVTGATGGASMAFISAGVFFVNGSFVSVRQQSIVIGKYTNTPSCHVLLQIKESIIDSETDSSLLDPAQGSYNFAAPGADRLKIELVLTTLELNAVVDNNYIEIMRYNDGVLEEHLRYPKYNELEKSLARRTYDESGDYVVSGLEVTTREHLKSTLNGGRYNAPTGDATKFIATTSVGKAYLRGFEHELISPREIVVDKARGAEHLETISANLSPSYGQMLYVTNVTGLPNFLQRTTVSLYNATSSGTLIGTAQVISIDYYAPNTTDTNAIFKLCVSSVALTGGYSIADIGLITFAGGQFTVLNKLTILPTNSTNFVLNEILTNNSTRLATVHKFTRATGELFVFKHAAASAVPIVGDNVSAPSTAAGRLTSVEIVVKGTNDNLLVELPTESTYRVKNGSNVSDISYKIYYETSVTTNGSGAGSFSVTGMTIDPKEQGNFIVSSSNGTILPLSVVTVAPDGLSVSFAGATVSATLKIVCAATKIGANASPKTKTLTTAFSESGLTSSASVALSRADIVRLISVVSSVDGTVTDRYTLDNGQRDYAYLLGAINVKADSIVPSGTLTVVYDYFTHNAGSGDYFSVDSYESSGIANYYDSPLLTYKSSNTGKTYDLRDVLDFRSRVGNDGLYTSGTASLARVVQNDSRLTTSIRQYIGRVDAVVMNGSGDIEIITGTPSSTPKLPFIPSGVLFLSTLNIPAYTFNVGDIAVKKQKNRVYTMKDVGKIDTRLQTLEEFVLLTETESFAVNYDVVDAATGLSRYKSGYLVDTFDNPDIISDITNPLFKATYISDVITPQFEVIEAKMFITNEDTQTTGTAVTLPYTSVQMISQPVSSKITNINPFSVFSWTGRMVLFPESDIWTEVEYLPTIINNITETITENVEVRRPFTGTLPNQVWDNTLSGDTAVTQTFVTQPIPVITNFGT